MGWKNFITDPPHEHSHCAGMECDPDIGFILFRYTQRGEDWMPGRNWIFVSGTPYPFINGAFGEGEHGGYRSHMITSPYPEDRIEVIAWLPYDEAKKLFMKSANDWLRESALEK